MLRYAITGGRLTDVHGAEADRLILRCEQLAEEKVDFLLLREKALALDQIAHLTREVVQRVSGSGLKILVHSNAELALAEGAAGVHVSYGALVRGIHAVFPGAFVSVSCHTLAEVDSARRENASAVLFGPVFGKTVEGTRVVPPTGLDRLREACKAAHPMPVLALGGVAAENASACITAGARGIAGIRMFFPG